MATVLVTGGSGFVAGHCIVQLLAAGHTVRTTVRSKAARTAPLLEQLKAGGAKNPEAVEIFAAELTADAGWAEAVAGCDYVLHVASPFPVGVPEHEDELVVPAREGTLRVLRAAKDAGVKRVVLTSSFAAIGYGHGRRKEPFTEADWTNLSAPITAYPKSKTLAERAAWDFVEQEGGIELSVINPVGIFGPLLGPDMSASVQLLLQLLSGKMIACPRLYFGVVDVRDVADLHLRAMTHPAAAGQRFLAVGGDFVSLAELGRILHDGLGPAGAKAPTRQLPDWLVRLLARFNPLVRQAIPELGQVKNASSQKARELLGWEPRSPWEAVLATGQGLVHLGLT